MIRQILKPIWGYALNHQFLEAERIEIVEMTPVWR